MWLIYYSSFLCLWASWFESYLVANPEVFSRDLAHLLFEPTKKKSIVCLVICAAIKWAQIAISLSEAVSSSLSTMV